MGGMHVAHLETGPLSRQTARAKRREAPLVGNLGQRIGLIHELAKLGRTKEFSHRRRRRLGVDQIMRHHTINLDRTHAFTDRPLHAEESDAVLIFH